MPPFLKKLASSTKAMATSDTGTLIARLTTMAIVPVFGAALKSGVATVQTTAADISKRVDGLTLTANKTATDVAAIKQSINDLAAQNGSHVGSLGADLDR